MPKQINTKLLDILYVRLGIAVEFEKKRNIVLPETTAIIRDIMRVEGITIQNAKQNAKNESGAENHDEFDF